MHTDKVEYTFVDPPIGYDPSSGQLLTLTKFSKSVDTNLYHQAPLPHIKKLYFYNDKDQKYYRCDEICNEIYEAILSKKSIKGEFFIRYIIELITCHYDEIFQLISSPLPSDQAIFQAIQINYLQTQDNNKLARDSTRVLRSNRLNSNHHLVKIIEDKSMKFIKNVKQILNLKSNKILSILKIIELDKKIDQPLEKHFLEYEEYFTSSYYLMDPHQKEVYKTLSSFNKLSFSNLAINTFYIFSSLAKDNMSLILDEKVKQDIEPLIKERAKLIKEFTNFTNPKAARELYHKYDILFKLISNPKIISSLANNADEKILTPMVNEDFKLRFLTIKNTQYC